MSRARLIFLAIALAAAGCSPAQEQSAATPRASVPTIAPSVAPAATLRPSAPVPTIAPTPRASIVSYSSCAEVKAAGKAPIRRGDPGYSSNLDRDGDGIACET